MLPESVHRRRFGKVRRAAGLPSTLSSVRGCKWTFTVGTPPRHCTVVGACTRPQARRRTLPQDSTDPAGHRRSAVPLRSAVATRPIVRITGVTTGRTCVSRRYGCKAPNPHSFQSRPGTTPLSRSTPRTFGCATGTAAWSGLVRRLVDRTDVSRVARLSLPDRVFSPLFPGPGPPPGPVLTTMRGC